MTFAGRDIDHMLKIVNKMNEDLILWGFGSEPHAEGITLIGDYSLSYEGGLVDRHLMNAIKLFSKVFAHSREVGFRQWILGSVQNVEKDHNWNYFLPPEKIRTPDGKIVEVIGFKCQNENV